jgi:16S rRNA (guanine527-N7)-methyltransferase
VGSGAGLPGLVLAVARPHTQVALLDPSLKRTRFLIHAVQALELGNVSVLRARLEEHAPGAAVDNVTSRAALALDRLAAQVPRLLAPGGRLVAMLGRAPPAGSLTLPPGWHIELRPLCVPGVDGARHAAIVCRQDAPH